ncbi:DEAD/DEAH box helicase family protein [Psychrobacter arenosus]|uniref:DEAD/DEAH box helicase family protein n=1 Tax=Psychrobacter arenosus TaxID=256326 RepID=UPI0019180BA9|nr:DEAD/DEAH box helicase family protein [Psychrobacter arenosus]
MKTILEHYLQPENLGLLLLDMPTGSGKTYSIIEYIATHIDTLRQTNRKIIFITPLKKNLPLKDLKRRLQAHGKSEYFEREVLFVQSTKDAFIAHFSECEHDIARLFPSYDCFSVKEAIKGLNNLALKQVLEPILNKKGSELSRLVSNTLRNKHPVIADRIELIKTDPQWQWVSKLFPSVLTTERSVLFMSVAKFVYPYQTLVQPLMPFSELLSEYHTTLFIDEVDASKQVLQSYIIEQGLTNTLELVPTVRQVASRLRESKLPTNLILQHKLTKQPVTPSEIENNFRQLSQNVVEEFKTDLSLKSREENNHTSFIFYDKSTHYLADANDKIITIEPDYEHSTLWINFDKKDLGKKGQKTTLGKLLGQHRYFIEWFKGGLAMLANNYYFQRRDTVGISFEDAARSYLDFFHLPEATVKQLVNEIQYKRLSKSWLHTVPALASEQLPSARFYEHGFIYHSISNGESHAGRSKVLSFNFPCAAELILLSWCRQFMVVGVSATANIKSRLGNYDLHYLQSSLNADPNAPFTFHTLSPHHKQALQQQFDASKARYDQIDIQTHWQGLPNGLSESEVLQHLSELFGIGREHGADQDDITDLTLQIKEQYPEQQYIYRLSQYYKIFRLWSAHLTQETVAFLLLSGKGYRDQELQLIHEFCQLLSNYHQHSDRYASEEIVSVVGDNSTQTLAQLKSDLATGKRRFVLSTYATLGAGINIQFPIPANHPRELLKINAFNADSYTDFDALYLDKPTNVLVNTNGNGSITDKDLAKHLYQLEYLKISGLTYSDFHQYLQKAFLAYIGQHSYQYAQESIYHSNDYRLHIMQILIQAVGRICRTNMKSPTIHLHLDREISKCWHDDLDDMPLLPEFQKISAAVNSYRQNSSLLVDAVLSKDMMKVRDAIYQMLARFKDGAINDGVIDQWQLIRNVCLKHPQYDDNTNKKYRFFYTNFSEPKSAYYYQQEDDYREVNILIDKQPYSYKVSEASAKLDKLMQHPILKSHFISHGYATSLPASKHWLQPILFNNIYKGALGEVCGSVLWEQYDLPHLYQMPKNQFEIFDFQVNDKVFVDFKHWTISQHDGEKIRRDIFNKIQGIDAKLVFVINIISDTEHLSYRLFEEANKQIIEIPNFILDGKKLIELVELINNKISEH